MKKIMILLPANVAGGAERVLVSLANAFAEKGIKVYFLTFDSSSNFYRLNDEVNLIRLQTDTDGWSLKRKLLLGIFLESKRFLRIRKIMKKYRPDIVLSFMFMTNIIGIMASKSLKIPFVISERNDPNHYSFLKRLIMRFFYAKADGFICQSERMKKDSKRRYGIENIEVIPNPLTKNQIGRYIKSKNKYIISVGRLIPQKNHELLIRAFAFIADLFPEYNLYIYGEGPLREKLEKIVSTEKMSRRIFLPGVESNVMVKHSDASLFVMSSNFEGYPNALAEAMASGIPSICTDFDSGSARDLINDKKNGLLIPCNDLNSLVKALKYALTHEDKMRKMSLKALNLYDSTNIDTVSNAWLEYFERIVE